MLSIFSEMSEVWLERNRGGGEGNEESHERVFLSILSNWIFLWYFFGFYLVFFSTFLGISLSIFWIFLSIFSEMSEGWLERLEVVGEAMKSAMREQASEVVMDIESFLTGTLRKF